MELKIDKLSKQFSTKVAVDQVSVTLKPGITGLLGSNGSGKTTLMKMMVDVLCPDQGSVIYNGEAIQTLKEKYLIDLGYLPQELGMYPSFKVVEFLNYMGCLKGLSQAYLKERIHYLLKELNLEGQRNKKIKQLSGGMKQRLGIAQALLNDPNVLILDEPTVGLDPKERNHFSIMLSEMAQDKIIILSTHIVSDIENIAHHIMIMKNGELIDYDTPQALCEKIEDQVYEQFVSYEEFKQLRQHAIICNQKKQDDGIYVRYITTSPSNGTLVKPLLSDVYLYHFEEEGEW